MTEGVGGRKALVMKLGTDKRKNVVEDFYNRAKMLFDLTVPRLIDHGNYIDAVGACRQVDDLVTIALLVKENYPVSSQVIATGRLPKASVEDPMVAELAKYPMGTIIPSQRYTREIAQKAAARTDIKLGYMADVLAPFIAPKVNKRKGAGLDSVTVKRL